MRKLIDNPYLILVLRIAFAGIFLFAAYSKIVDPAAFAKNVNNFHILPGGFVNVFALTLPWVEALVGFGLLFGIWGRASAWLTALMLVMFTVAIFVAIANGVNINCGCFTQNPEVKSSLTFDVVRDIVMLIFVTPLLFTKAERFGW